MRKRGASSPLLSFSSFSLSFFPWSATTLEAGWSSPFPPTLSFVVVGAGRYSSFSCFLPPPFLPERPPCDRRQFHLFLPISSWPRSDKKSAFSPPPLPFFPLLVSPDPEREVIDQLGQLAPVPKSEKMPPDPLPPFFPSPSFLETGMVEGSLTSRDTQIFQHPVRYSSVSFLFLFLFSPPPLLSGRLEERMQGPREAPLPFYLTQELQREIPSFFPSS